MAATTATTRMVSKRGGRWVAGLLALVLGLFGMAIWAAVASFSASYGIEVATPDGVITNVGVDDPVNEPGVWTGRTDEGVVVWEGTKAEYDALADEAAAQEQASLRRTWLFPSAAIAVVGFGLLVSARRRTTVHQSP